MTKLALTAVAIATAALAVPAAANAAPIPPCSSGQLQVSAARNLAASGHYATILTFSVAPGARSCTLTGYPGVDSTADGAPLLHAERSMSGFMGGLTGHTPPTVTVSSWQPAYAMVEGRSVDANGDDCPKYTDLHVTPPDTTDTVTLHGGVGCDLFVHPVGFPAP